MEDKSALQLAFGVLAKLEQAQGRLVKEALLEQHRDNPALKVIFRLALGPYRYFVTPPHHLVANAIWTSREAWRAFVPLVKRLRTREVTGAAAIDEVRQFLANCPPEAGKWFARVLNHDLRVGVGVDTVKAIWGDEFLLGHEAKTEGWRFNGCALAKKWQDCCPQYPLAVERKLDGERALLFVWPATSTLIVATRGAKRRPQIEELLEFKQQLIDLVRRLNDSAGVSPDRPLFLDGEFIGKNWNETSSVVRKTKNFSGADFLAKVVAALFDWAPLDQYLTGTFALPWVRRKSELLAAAGCDRIRATATKFSPNVVVLGHAMAYNQEQLYAEYTACVDLGFEGIVAKVPDAPLVLKRSDYLVKLKPEDTVTATITGAVPGRGKHAEADLHFVKQVLATMQRYGDPADDGAYYCWTVPNPAKAKKSLLLAVADDADRRIVTTDTEVLVRYGARLGYFTAVLSSGDELHVGGGFKHRDGNDERMQFWLRRDELIGKKIDVKIQQDQQQVGIGRFNRFVRFRDDL